MAEQEERYVSLVPSVTETLFALGVGQRVVGLTKFCVRPAPAVEGIAKVGGTKDPRIDRILGLEPSLVLLNEEENRVEDLEALTAAGVRVHTSFPRTVDDVPRTLRELGALVGRSARAEELARDVEEAAAEARRGAGREPVPFAVLVWRAPWIAAGPTTYLSDLLATAGGVNVLAATAGAPRYPEVTPEELGELSPARVLLPSEPFPWRARHRDELVARSGLGREVFLPCDGELLTWHGPRTAAGLRRTAGWLRGRAPGSPSGPDDAFG